MNLNAGASPEKDSITVSSAHVPRILWSRRLPNPNLVVPVISERIFSVLIERKQPNQVLPLLHLHLLHLNPLHLLREALHQHP